MVTIKDIISDEIFSERIIATITGLYPLSSFANILHGLEKDNDVYWKGLMIINKSPNILKVGGINSDGTNMIELFPNESIFLKVNLTSWIYIFIDISPSEFIVMGFK
jgi:hypothetical protein